MKLFKPSTPYVLKKKQVSFWLYIHYASPVGDVFIRALCVRYDRGILSFLSEIIFL